MVTLTQWNMSAFYVSKLLVSSLLQSFTVGRTAILHVDDLRLSVDKTDTGDQHDAADDRGQHEVAGRQQHVGCPCLEE
jgi:hypothetical protein